MSSRFGGVPVEDTSQTVSKFGGVPVSDETPQAKPDFVKDTLQKTAGKMNIENLLGVISDSDTMAGQGRYSDAFDNLRKLIPHPVDMVKGMYQEAKDGKYSDLASDAIPLLFAAEGATGGLSKAANAASDAASGVASSIGKSPVLAAAKTVIPSASDVVQKLPGVADAIKTVQATHGAVSTAMDAYQAQSRLNATEAAASANRANPRVSLPVQAGIAPEAPVAVPPVQPIQPAAATSRSLAPAPQPTPAAPVVAPMAIPQVVAKPPRIPLWQRTAVPKTLSEAAASEDLPQVPSPYQEAFEGDKGGTLSPQETQARANIVNKLAPALLKAGLDPEDLDTATGRLKVSKIAQGIPGLSENKKFLKSIEEYDPSDTTLEQTRTLMSQWDKFANMMGYKTLADFGRK